MAYIVQYIKDFSDKEKVKNVCEKYTKLAYKVKIYTHSIYTCDFCMDNVAVEYSENPMEQAVLAADKLYAENYLIYKRLAFLEMDVQAALNHSSRDYKTFDEYVKKCDEYYRKGNRTEVDMEMEYLYQVYDEVVVKGWLK